MNFVKRNKTLNEVLASYYCAFCLVFLLGILLEFGIICDAIPRRNSSTESFTMAVNYPQHNQHPENNNYYNSDEENPRHFSGFDGISKEFMRMMMLHNQEQMSSPGKIPLYKQSYPGLYTGGQLKEFAYEPTTTVTHRNSHHGKEGHLFLQPGREHDTFHLFTGDSHAINHDQFN